MANQFVNWDDSDVIVQNLDFRGLSGPHLWWMFTTGHAGHYQPLTWLSYALESQLWGVDPAGFHFTNLLLHLGTTIAFFFVAGRLIRGATGPPQGNGQTIGALLAALLFAVHPLRVESVAWATERRDVLSGIWLVLTVLFYLQAAEALSTSRRRSGLALASGCYGLSLLSKAAGITLPLVLLILDVYLLRRVSGATRDGPAVGRRVSLRWLVIEKVPFFAAAVVFGLLGLWAQSQAGALRSSMEQPLGLRVGQAFYGTVFYIWKTIWPVGLIPLYEQDPNGAAFDPENVAAAALFVILTGTFWLIRRHHPAFLTAWGVYLTFLLPVLGFAQSGPQIVADRYSYLSCMPWAVLAGGAAAQLWASLPRRIPAIRPALAVIGMALVITLALLTRRQTLVWADSYTLWSTVIQRAPDTGVAHANLASLLNREGKHEQAREHAREALRILPGNRTAHIALARASMALGDYETAEEHFRISLEIRPNDPVRLTDLAYVKAQQGQFEAAEQLYRKVIEVAPDSPLARFNLGSFLAGRDQDREAKLYLEEAVALDPSLTAAWFRLALVRWRANEPAAAIGVLESALAYTPDDPSLNAKLAWMLATCPIDDLRDGPRAVDLATRALDQDPARSVLSRESLAAALAETGDFARAVAVLDEVLTDSALDLPDATRKRVAAERSDYQAGRPMRDPRAVAP